jgi:hypothetical protein
MNPTCLLLSDLGEALTMNMPCLASAKARGRDNILLYLHMGRHR